MYLLLGKGYEWDIGHFEGAERPIVNSFRSTSVGLSDQEVRLVLSCCSNR